MSRRLLPGAFTIAAIYLAVNVFTAERSPTVSMDEVWFAEPAINLVEGRGFTTAAWDTQDRTEVWAGNAPLYSLLLSGWLRVAPFSPRGVRSLNYVLTLLAAAAVCFGAWRFGLIRRRGPLLLLFAAILCSYSISFSSRSGRYDCTAMLLFALVFATASLRKPILVACVAIFIIPAGFQLSVYAAVLCVLVLVFIGRAALPYVLALGAGLVVGLAVLITFYAANGVLGDFFATLGRHSVAGMAMASEASPFNRLAGKWRQIPKALVADPFNLLLVVVLGVWAHREPLSRLAMTLAIALPVIVQVLYVYRIYYGWMIVIPLLVAALMVDHRATRIAALVVIAGGLPLRWTLTAVEWRSRDYAPVERLVARHVHRGEWVFADWQAYYPVKNRADVAFFPPYARMLTSSEKDRISLLILGAESAKLRYSFPGHWVEVDSYRSPAPGRNFGARPYSLTVWRRLSFTAP